MADISSWAWMGTGTWPNFALRFGVPRSDNYLNNSGNGLTINPANYTEIIWRDGNNDGAISDNDGGDSTTAGTDRVIINGVAKTVHEIGAYTNSTFTANGVTYTVTMGVWIFTDGTYMVRINDDDIPNNVHFSTVSNITLGTWNGTEYGGSLISTRDDPFICFAAGTMVDTPDGPRAVESLSAGDLVNTLDNGAQPIRWLGTRTISGSGRFAPVLLRKGALGNTCDIRLSPHHRIMVSGWRAELHAGCEEVLVAAHHLVNDQMILRAPVETVTYVHLLFDAHQIVNSSGLWSESFHPSAYGLGVLEQDTRAEVIALFPECDDTMQTYGPTVRTCLKAWEARTVIAA
jgi:hypothetical protein